MKSKLKINFSVVLLVATVFTRNSGATVIPPAWDSQVGPSETTFTFTGGYATVECNVYKYDTSNEYVYSYVITNHSNVGISFFSVGIADGADAWSPDYDGQDTVFCSTAESPTQVESVNYMFASTIDDTEVSSVLWFKSSFAAPVAPVAEAGMLFGRDGDVRGALLTPVPEPATIFLLGAGGLMTVVCKRQPAKVKVLKRKSSTFAKPVKKQSKYSF